jgi:multidrug efflux system membrane fusion protein
MKRSYLIAGILALAATGWVVSGQVDQDGSPKTARKPPADLTATQIVPTVRVRRLIAQPHQAEVILRGRTEATRKVDVKAETYGRIIELKVEKGDWVEKGAVLARLSPGDRPARLAEAKALRDQRKIEYEASHRLSKKGYRAETQLAGAKAALEAAAAAVTRAQVALRNTTIRAPFDGLMVARAAEIGDFIDKGDPVARIIDLDPVLAVAQISERDRGRVTVGAPARVTLTGGREVSGEVRFVAAEAEASTRTFRIEVELPNPAAEIPDGITAEIRLPLGAVAAHRVSPAILTLTDDGTIGVKTLGPDNRVRFRPIQIIGDGTDGVWLSGLPNRITLITVGQEFVAEGQIVRPVDEADLPPVSGSGS